MLNSRKTVFLAIVFTAVAPATAASPQAISTEQNGDWSAENRAALQRALAARNRHGLDSVDLPSPQGSAANFDAAALAYANALAHGVTDPNSLHAVYTVPRPEQPLSDGLARALRENRLASWLESLAPQDAAYRTLGEAYIVASEHGSAAANSPLSIERLLRVGDDDPDVATLAAQLHEDGYLAEVGTGTQYTQAIADAVTQLQRDYGIVADGVVGPDTLAVLNLRPGDRARALAVALERRRWLSRTPPATRIDVNTAAATLRYYRDGALIDERRVIVGEPGKETPALQSPIYRLVANPTWTIPKSIQHGELAGVSRGYLRAHNMVRRGGWIVQRSGPDNALGLVKFDMTNHHAIYLHDTSSPGLFDRSQRHLSHGCVRVADALGFADMLAEQEGVAEDWRRARQTGKQTFVALPRQIPVRMLYHNVSVRDDGQIAYRTDPYGWNAPIAKALGFTGEAGARARPEAIDVGP